MKKILAVLLFLSMFTLTGCGGEQIKGKEIKNTFTRSDYYTVSYGTEVHFEMGTLEPVGKHVVCDDYSYYDDWHARYVIQEDTITTYVPLDDEYFKLEMDNFKTFPTYDIDIFESYLFDHNYTKNVISTKYSYKDEDMHLWFRELKQDFSYELHLFDEDLVYRFDNSVDEDDCNVNFDEATAITLSDYLSRKFDEIIEELYIFEDFTLESIDYHVEDNTITLKTIDDTVVFHLEDNSADFFIDEDIEYSYNLDTRQYSWSLNNSGNFLPESITDKINPHHYLSFIRLFESYQYIFHHTPPNNI